MSMHRNAQYLVNGPQDPALLAAYAEGNRCDIDRAEWAGRVATAVMYWARNREAKRLAVFREYAANGNATGAAAALEPGPVPRMPWWAMRLTWWHGLLRGAVWCGHLLGRWDVAAAISGVTVPAHMDPNITRRTGYAYRWHDMADYVNGAEHSAVAAAVQAGVVDLYRCANHACTTYLLRPVPLGDHYYCQSCAALRESCYVCGHVEYRDDMTPMDGERYCGECADETLERCHECGTAYPGDDEPRCSCVSVEIHCYGYKPAPVFRYREPGGAVATSRVGGDSGLVLGVEIELESCGYWSALRHLDGAEWLRTGFAYMKRDGSLTDGVEIVTHPATVSAWRELATGFDSMGGELAEHGWEATENCGVHVHVSRQAFRGVAHLARFGVLWHSWRDGIVGVAGRPGSYYAEWSDAGRRRVVQYAVHGHTCPRYSPVNFQPGETVEIRCFASTTDAATLLGRIETVAAAVEFSALVNSADILAGRADWHAFTDYLADNYAAAAALTY